MEHNDRLSRGQLELIQQMIKVVRVPECDDEETIDVVLGNFDSFDPDGSKVDDLEKWVKEELEGRLP